MENTVTKTPEEKCAISVEVINLLAEKNCTINEAKELLDTARRTIEHTSMVQKLDWSTKFAYELFELYK